LLILGIDPGSNATGYAAVQRVRGRFHLVEAGVIRTQAGQDMGQRLARIHAGIAEVIARVQPDAAAIEAIFKHKSSESALRLGHARGVAMLALAQAGLEIGEYNPMTVKKTIGGHGRAGKPEMVRVVTRLLGQEKPLASDAADAAAIAMTHLGRVAFNSRLPPTSRPTPRSP
jgi:crossover junction endodeoxyribonuclease RuvC